MKKFLFYLNVQLKRIFRLLPTFMAVSAIALAVIGTAFFVFSKNSQKENDQKKIPVGVVGEMKSDLINAAGIKAIQQLDYSSSYIELKEMSEKEAEEALNRGKIAAFVIIPEGFIDSVNYGMNDKQITLVTGSGSNDVLDLLKTEAAKIVASYVTSVQASIYGTQQIVRESRKWGEDRRSQFSKITIDLNVKFLDYVMKRSSFAKIKLLGNGRISQLSYYFCALIIICLMFASLNSVPFFSGRNRELCKILYSRKVTAVHQVAAEFAAYLFFLLLYLALIFLILIFAVKSEFFVIREWKFRSVEKELLFFFLKSLVALLSIGSLQFLLFEAAETAVSKVSFQFLGAFFLCYFSGCFYPIEFFPASVRQISVNLPVGSAFVFLQNALTHSPLTVSLIENILYSIVFITISVFIRRKKLNAF